MQDQRQSARTDFQRMMKWAVVAAVLMVVAALLFLKVTGDLTPEMVIATVFGVFLSVMLGAGLMAASYFSAKSGLDQDVNEAAHKGDPNP